MLKMFASALEKKEMPPAKQQLQPTIKERAEMVEALNTLAAEAPAGDTKMQGDAMVKKLGSQLTLTARLNLGAPLIHRFWL